MEQKLSIASIHQEQKHFQCKFCDSKFTQNCHLKRHVISIHDRKSYKCEFCDYKATQKHHLERHSSSIHEGKKPFKCKICMKTFSEGWILKTHTSNIHEGKIESNDCEVCNYEATQKGF